MLNAINKKVANPFVVSIGIHIILLGVFSFIQLKKYIEEKKYITIDVINHTKTSKSKSLKKLLSDIDTRKTNKKALFKQIDSNLSIPLEKKMSRPNKVELKMFKSDMVIHETDEKSDVADNVKEININEKNVAEKEINDIKMEEKQFLYNKVEPLEIDEKIELIYNKKTVDDKENEVTLTGNNYNLEWLSGLKNRKLIHKSDLKYPDKLKKRNIQGKLKLKFVVNPDGQVINVIIVRKGYPDLDRLVIQQFQKWRFEPLNPKIQQVNQEGEITFNFQLH